MKTMPFAITCLWWLIAPAGFAAAQTPVLPPPVVRPSVITNAVVPQRVPPRVVEVAPVVPSATVTARPVVRETLVTPARTVTWWDAFGKLRYGFYDDGFSDDNWYFDYYEMPPATVAVEQPV